MNENALALMGSEVQRMTRALTMTMESEIQAAINACGGPWPIEVMQARCRIVRVGKNDISMLFIDGKAVLEIHPPESTPMTSNGTSYRQQIIQKFIRLYKLRGDDV